MIKTLHDVMTFLHHHQSSAYTRDNLDAFLREYPLGFTRPAIHVTGSNGKGSTATYLASMYAQAYKRVGLFTSPPLEDYSEMIRINGIPIDETFIITYFQQWSDIFKTYLLTYFEMTTLLAFAYFQHHEVDIAIIEVGMGGRLDATNIFTPIVSIITNVSLEHVDYLGPTIEDIALHKAGIIKPSIPVITGPLSPSVHSVIHSVATSLSAPFLSCLPFLEDDDGAWIIGPYQGIHTTMQGSYQRANVTLAISAVHALLPHFPLPVSSIQKGIQEASIAGRFEKISDDPLIVLDGAHNPAGVEALVETIDKKWKDKSIIILFAAFKDKAIDPMLTLLSSRCESLVLTTFPHARARGKKDYQAYSYPFEEDYQTWLNQMKQTMPKNRVLLITGSLAFIGQVRHFLKVGK